MENVGRRGNDELKTINYVYETRTDVGVWITDNGVLYVETGEYQVLMKWLIIVLKLKVYF